MPLLFSKIWGPLCCLFVRVGHGCFLFFNFTLATFVFARAEVERERYSKTSESGVDICQENLEKIQKYSTVDYPTRTRKAKQMNGRLKKESHKST